MSGVPTNQLEQQDPEGYRRRQLWRFAILSEDYLQERLGERSVDLRMIKRGAFSPAGLVAEESQPKKTGAQSLKYAQIVIRTLSLRH